MTSAVFKKRPDSGDLTRALNWVGGQVPDEEGIIADIDSLALDSYLGFPSDQATFQTLIAETNQPLRLKAGQTLNVRGGGLRLQGNEKWAMGQVHLCGTVNGTVNFSPTDAHVGDLYLPDATINGAFTCPRGVVAFQDQAQPTPKFGTATVNGNFRFGESNSGLAMLDMRFAPDGNCDRLVVNGQADLVPGDQTLIRIVLSDPPGSYPPSTTYNAISAAKGLTGTIRWTFPEGLHATVDYDGTNVLVTLRRS
jgi:hypothetical protein